jgi:hypothetical protein
MFSNAWKEEEEKKTLTEFTKEDYPAEVTCG